MSKDGFNRRGLVWLAIGIVGALGLSVVLCLGAYLLMLHHANSQPLPPPRADISPPRPPAPKPAGAMSPRVDQPVRKVPTPPAPTKPSQPPTFTFLRSFDGHKGAVYGVCFTPDGHHGLTAGADGTLRLWDTESGREEHRFPGHAGAVRCIAVAPDGKRAVSAGDDEVVHLWDMDQRKPLALLKGHRGPVHAVAFSADGKRVLSGGEDRSVRLWSVETAASLGEYYGHDAPVHAVAFSADGARALSGSDEGGALLWDLKDGKELCFFAVRIPVRAVAFHPDGQRAILGSQFCRSFWDLKEGIPWNDPQGVGTRIESAALLPNGQFILFGGPEKRIELARLPNRATPRSGGVIVIPSYGVAVADKAHAGTVLSVALTRDGSRCLSAGADGAVKLWELPPAVLAGGPWTGR